RTPAAASSPSTCLTSSSATALTIARARAWGSSSPSASWACMARASTSRASWATERGSGSRCRAARPEPSELDLGADLDDAVGRDREEVGRRAGVAREIAEQALAPGRHAAIAVVEQQRLAAEIEARVRFVQLDAVGAAGAQD